MSSADHHQPPTPQPAPQHGPAATPVVGVPALGPRTPPTSPGRVVLTRPGGNWAMPLGIVFAVLGGLAALASVAQLIASLVLGPLAESFAKAAAPQGMDPMAAMKQYSFELAAANLLLAACGVLLVVGGVLLSQRRPVAVPLLRTWAVLKIIAAVGATYVQILMQDVQMQAVAQQTQSSGTPVPAGMFRSIAWFSGAFSLAWYLILPLFVLVWFALPKARKQVSEWKTLRRGKLTPTT